MNTAATVSADTTSALDSKVKSSQRQYLNLPRKDWTTAIVFLLVLAMTGLKFPLGYLLLPIFLIHSFRTNRYDFIIQLTITCGGYAMLAEDNFPVKLDDLAMIVGFIGIFVYRKPPLVLKAVIAFIIYAVSLIALASFSDETMGIQFRVLRTWLAFIYFMVPLMAFAGKNFNMHQFFLKVAPYALTLCVFYIIDGFIISGHILVPRSYFTNYYGEYSISTFTSPALFGIGTFPRKYPPGLFIMALIIFPLTRTYKLHWYQWLFILGALMASKTFTIIVALIFGFMVFQPNPGKSMKFGLLAVILLSVGYAVDSSLPIDPNNENSTLRIKSSLDQIFALEKAEDDEDIAETGSGRIAQMLPKFELMYKYNKEWTGVGFLHPELTKSTKYIIINEYYSDIERSEEVATGIEVVPLQVMLTVGYIGLAVHLAFFLFLYFIIRRLKYSLYFLSVEVVVFIFGLGGFAGWIMPMGLFLLALAFSAVLLANRNEVWSKYNKETHNLSSIG